MMKRALTITVLTLALAVIPAASSEPPEGFKAVFNGHDLTGWEGLEGYWSVKNGVIDGSETKDKSKQTFLILSASKTDPKKFKYTMTVVADDKTIEKKDKTADEPVQFYVHGVPHPYEIVVFDVTKDKINGYLSTPKDTGSAKTQ